MGFGIYVKMSAPPLPSFLAPPEAAPLLPACCAALMALRDTTSTAGLFLGSALAKPCPCLRAEPKSEQVLLLALVLALGPPMLACALPGMQPRQHGLGFITCRKPDRAPESRLCCEMHVHDGV